MKFIRNHRRTGKSFDKISDGLWYFHTKAIKKGVWGTTGHFLIRIDTAPPADFKPKVDYLVAAIILTERTLVSFFTTDNLSGVDHYEVGVIDKNQPLTESPVFVQADSPFQVPLIKDGKLEVIVRAVDRAGNVRDSSIPVEAPFIITQFVADYIVYILLGIILLGLVMLLIHYLVGHHIIRAIRKARQIMNKEDEQNNIERRIDITTITPTIPAYPHVSMPDYTPLPPLPPPPHTDNHDNYIDRLN